MTLTRDLDNFGLGAVLKTALDAVVVMRTDGTVAGWNDVAERTFGWSFAQVSDRRMSDLIIPARLRASHERGLAHYLATGEGPVLDRHIEIDALHRDGHELPVELSITRTEQFGEPVFLGFLRDISKRREAVRRQDLMIGELNHRVKNLLGVVTAIAHQTIDASSTLADFAPAFSGRLESLGHAYEILTAGSWQQAPVSALVQALLEPYHQPDDGAVSIIGPEVMLVPRHFLSLGMILHELVTNAVKYGALSTPDGKIRLEWRHDGDTMVMRWEEQSSLTIGPPVHKGFGTRMIAFSVQYELHGEASMEWRNNGMVFELSFRTS